MKIHSIMGRLLITLILSWCTAITWSNSDLSYTVTATTGQVICEGEMWIQTCDTTGFRNQYTFWSLGISLATRNETILWADYMMHQDNMIYIKWHRWFDSEFNQWDEKIYVFDTLEQVKTFVSQNFDQCILQKHSRGQTTQNSQGTEWYIVVKNNANFEECSMNNTTLGAIVMSNTTQSKHFVIVSNNWRCAPWPCSDFQEILPL